MYFIEPIKKLKYTSPLLISLVCPGYGVNGADYFF